eukprot:scaffold46594_cov199-Amphora_coffeaeformis.AAC.1
MERARRLHRPSLKDWQRDGMYQKFPSYVKDLEASNWKDELCIPSCNNHNNNNSHTKVPTALPVRVDARRCNAETFALRYEATCTPCVITHVPQVQQWPALHRWTLEALNTADNDLRSRVFKCGEDDDGHSIKVKLRHFLGYLQHNRDDSPLYIFDTAFDEDRVASRLLQDYSVPLYFRNDLFRYVSESRRAPYRWFLVGPERSGTTVHIDPLGTSAWNTLLVGKKQWVLFPPHVPKHVVKGKGLIAKHEDDEAIHYFTTILPRIKQRAREQNDPAYRNFACYEFTQHAGETVFVPTGWWHAVLNLQHTVGCTQNFCSPQNFDAVWRQTRRGRKKMAWKWLQQLQQYEPALYQRAVQLNRRDQFVMKYDPSGVTQCSQKMDDEKRKRKSSV